MKTVYMTGTDPDTLALIARLSRGIEHRINNLLAVLLITRQQLVDDTLEPIELGEVLDQQVHALRLMLEVFSESGERASAGTQVRALASLLSGMDPRLTVEAGECVDVRTKLSRRQLSQVLLAAAFVLLGVSAHADHITLEAIDVANGNHRDPDVEIRLTLHRASPTAFGAQDLESGAHADLALCRKLATAADLVLDVEAAPEGVSVVVRQLGPD